jgi:hypothetical protein
MSYKNIKHVFSSSALKHIIKKRRYQIYCAGHVFGITFTRYAQNQKIGKPKFFKVFGSNKIKRPKQDSQNRLRSPMPEVG